MLFLFMNSTYIRTEPNPEKSVRAETRNEVSIAYALITAKHPKNFARFARSVLGSQKNFRASRGDVIFFTKSFKKIPRFARDVIFFTKSKKKSPALRAGGTIFYKNLKK